MSRKHHSSISHDEAMVDTLRRDSKFAVEYLKASLEACDEPGGQNALLSALKQIAEARGIAAVAKAAGIPRESLYRVLSPKGNPRLTTLLAVVRAMGLQVTVKPATGAR